jgi:hypothetical protein
MEITNIKDFCKLIGFKGRFREKIAKELDEKLNIFENEINEKKLNKEDYIIFGGMVKSLYNLRSCTDIDFIIDVPQGTDIVMFDSEQLIDFGVSDNFCEVYFNPTNPRNYKTQQSANVDTKKQDNNPKILEQDEKPKILEQDKNPKILEQKSKFSCSGLKMGIYWSLYRQLIHRFQFMTGQIPKKNYVFKDFIDDKSNFISYRGFYFAKLEWEFLRDELKRLDLGYVSKKQEGDMENYIKFYSPDSNTQDALCFCKSASRYIFLHIGHEMSNGGKEIIIRRQSNKVRNIIGNILTDFHSFNHNHENIMTKIQYGQIWDNILLTSLFGHEMPNGFFKFILFANGGITIYSQDKIILPQLPIIIKGKIKYVVNDDKWKIVYNFDNFENTMFNTKEYKLTILDLMKTIFHLHKTYDQLCISNKVAIEYKPF